MSWIILLLSFSRYPEYVFTAIHNIFKNKSVKHHAEAFALDFRISSDSYTRIRNIIVEPWDWLVKMNKVRVLLNWSKLIFKILLKTKCIEVLDRDEDYIPEEENQSNFKRSLHFDIFFQYWRWSTFLSSAQNQFSTPHDHDFVFNTWKIFGYPQLLQVLP